MGFGMYFFLKNLYNFNIIGLYQRDLKMNAQSFFRKVRKQSGFTLLELMVVIAVISILASLAVPRFQNQMQKARFVEVINATAPFKTAVEICAQRTGAVATCVAGAAGIPETVGASPNGVVNGVTVGANGVITATGGANVDNRTYILTPTIPPNVNNVQSATGLSWTVDTTSTCLEVGLCDPS